MQQFGMLTLMTKEELIGLANKIKNNTASQEEKVSFFKELNSLLDKANQALDEIKQQDTIKDENPIKT
jgi:hypothetical protein